MIANNLSRKLVAGEPAAQRYESKERHAKHGNGWHIDGRGKSALPLPWPLNLLICNTRNLGTPGT